MTGGDSERGIIVTTQDVEAVFTNRGARLRHWRLKGYRDAAGAMVDLIPSSDNAVLRLAGHGRCRQDHELNDALFQVREQRAR